LVYNEKGGITLNEDKIRMALVDDNEEFCNVLKEFLNKQEDIEVVGIAHDGLEALQLVEESKPDVLILDIIMPHLDGLGVLEELHRNNRKSRPYTIILSAVGQDRITQKAIHLGADYYIVKPFDLNFFLKRVRESKEEFTNEGSFRDRNVNNGDKDLLQIENLLVKTMNDAGIPSHIKGYAYIKEAIIMVVRNKEYLNAITKELYPGIARKFDTTPSRVERAIRHSIEVAWKEGSQSPIRSVFNDFPRFKNSKKKPTNSEFIAVLSDKIRMQL